MSSSPSVYLNIRQITEVHHKDVLLKDVADIFCDNPALQNRCSAVKIRKIQKDKPKRYVETIVPVLEKLQKLDPNCRFIIWAKPSLLSITSLRKIQPGSGSGSKP